MPRTCTICSHAERETIETLLLEGVPFRHIAERFDTSTGALQRHRESHIPAQLARSVEAGELAAVDRLATELEEIKADVRRLRERAELEGDYRTALMGCDRALKALELQSKLAGELDESPTVNITIAAHVQAVILEALESYPEARLAVADALGELESRDE